MAKTQDYSAVMKDIMGAFPVDTTAFEGAFKNSAALNEKLSGVALDAAGKTYTMHMYEGANHGFHNDTTPRYDEEAAKLAQTRTIEFFNEHLR